MRVVYDVRGEPERQAAAGNTEERAKVSKGILSLKLKKEERKKERKERRGCRLCRRVSPSGSLQRAAPITSHGNTHGLFSSSALPSSAVSPVEKSPHIQMCDLNTQMKWFSVQKNTVPFSDAAATTTKPTQMGKGVWYNDAAMPTHDTNIREYINMRSHTTHSTCGCRKGEKDWKGKICRVCVCPATQKNYSTISLMSPAALAPAGEPLCDWEERESHHVMCESHYIRQEKERNGRFCLLSGPRNDGCIYKYSRALCCSSNMAPSVIIIRESPEPPIFLFRIIMLLLLLLILRPPLSLSV